MKRMICLALLALVAVPVNRAHAVSEGGVLFLMIPPDARSTAMGETGVAYAQGAVAAAWNPSMLGFVTHREITGSYFKYLPDLAPDLWYLHAGYAHPVPGIGTVGVSLQYLSLGEQQRTSAEGDDLGLFSSAEFAISLSYGTQIFNRLAVGTNLKIVRSNLAPTGVIIGSTSEGKGTATSFAVDLGGTYRLHNRFTVAGMVQNLGPDVSFIDEEQADPLPRNLKVGFALKIIDGRYNRLMIVQDFNKSLVTASTTKSISESILNSGAEYVYSNFIALRGGYIYDRAGKIKTPTFGGGLQWKLYRFDFSYTTSSTLQDITKFSVSAGF